MTETQDPNVIRIREHLARVARDAAFAPAPDAEHMRANVIIATHAAIKRMYDQGWLSSCRAIDIEVGEPVKLGERAIPEGAVPGDRFHKTGIIVSSDGNGHGVVFDPHAVELDPGQVRVSVEVELFRSLEYVVVDFKVADTAQ